MKRFQPGKAVLICLAVIGTTLGIGPATVSGAPAVNRIFELILGSTGDTLKAHLVGEKDELVKVQALMLAIARNKAEMATILLEHGVDLGSNLDDEFPINSKEKFDPEGETVLHRAARLGRVEIVKLLISKGAPLNPEDRLGRSPLDAVNEILIRAQSPNDANAAGKTGTKPPPLDKLKKLREISEILENAGGKSLKGGGMMIPIIIGFGVCGALGIFFFLRWQKSPPAGAPKGSKAVGTGKAGPATQEGWFSEAAQVGYRFLKAQWVEFCQARSGDSRKDATEQISQAGNAFTQKYFPKTASFSATFSQDELRLDQAFLVNHPYEIVPLPKTPKPGEWRTLPEIKGAVVMIDKEKIAREALGAYSKLVQLDLELDADGEALVGYHVKRDDVSWKCTEPDRLELELTLDSRGRLSSAKGKIFQS